MFMYIYACMTLFLFSAIACHCVCVVDEPLAGVYALNACGDSSYFAYASNIQWDTHVYILNSRYNIIQVACQQIVVLVSMLHTRVGCILHIHISLPRKSTRIITIIGQQYNVPEASAANDRIFGSYYQCIASATGA